jgi:UDP-N-acetyl-D-mannosaminuronate dehydrogenase
MKKIGFIGIGKLGLDCAEVMAEKHEVRGYDIYPRASNSVKERKRVDFYRCANSTCRRL